MYLLDDRLFCGNDPPPGFRVPFLKRNQTHDEFKEVTAPSLAALKQVEEENSLFFVGSLKPMSGKLVITLTQIWPFLLIYCINALPGHSLFYCITMQGSL